MADRRGGRGPPAGFRALLPCVLLPAAARRDRQGLAAALLAGHAPGETLGIVLGGAGLRRGDGGLAHGCSDVGTWAGLKGQPCV